MSTIALLDVPPVLPGAMALSFARPASLDAADLLIWRPAAIAEIYVTEGVHEGRPVLGVRDSQDAFRHTRFWRAEFQQFLGRGGTLVLFAPPFARLGLHTVQDIVDYDALEALPDHLALGHTECAPSSVDCQAGRPFAEFFAMFGPHFQARAEFRPRQAQAVATLEGSERVCALYQYRHPGRILVLPSLTATAEASVPGLLAQIVRALQDMSARLRFDARVGTTYAWRVPAPWPRELALQQELSDLAARRRALQQREATLIRELADLAFLGQLQRGDATGAMEAAAQVFHALGADVQHGKGRGHSLLVERDGASFALVAVDDAEVALGEALAAYLAHEADAWAADLQHEVMPIAFYIGGNRRGELETQAELRALQARHPTLHAVSGAELRRAHEAGDAALVLPASVGLRSATR